MPKITFTDFITSEDAQTRLLHKIAEEITAGYTGIPPAQISGHTLSERRPGKIKGEDVFNKIHELFNPLMEVQGTFPNAVRLNRELTGLSQKKALFAADRGDTGNDPNDAYIRIATETMMDKGGAYRFDYNSYRYAIIKQTLDNAWNSFQVHRQSGNRNICSALSDYKKILQNCFCDEEDILLNCIDVYAFLVIYSEKQNNRRERDTLLRITGDMIRLIQNMTLHAINITDELRNLYRT